MNTYEKHLQDRGLHEYTLDGAINPVEWAASDTRILFLLKENYGYQECGIIRISDLAHGWLDAGIPTYIKSVTLAAAVRAALQRDQLLSQSEIGLIERDGELMHKTLDKIAVVNIKKHSGESKSNDSEIRDESRINSALLSAQISALNPTVIVAGGTVCWHSLVHDIGLFSDAAECAKFSAVKCGEIVLCHSNHPSAWSGGGFDVETIHSAIYHAIKEA